ncbi:tRNA epoxyqueuosine(34) reductase QueG [Aurantivibrio infirmus]
MKSDPPDYQQLAKQIKIWGRELGFQHIGITDTQLDQHNKHLEDWLEKGYEGEMSWLSTHSDKRKKPESLHPGTLRVISARMDYLPGDTQQTKLLAEGDKAYIARYALGSDYHKLIRKRLAVLAEKISQAIGSDISQRPFVDSAPVLERAMAEKSGLGWIGKNTMLINKKAGSWFFLGELFTSLPLPTETDTSKNHCGTCHACLDICPTQAFAGPYELDARKCISYLTIEHKGSIPVELRKAIGNRVFGCDDCQIVCPWNKFAKPTEEKRFLPKHGLDNPDLCELFLWSEKEFLKNTEGSALRRSGYERWLRNLSVALGNAPSAPKIIAALKQRLNHESLLVREHVEWALKQHENKIALIDI